MVGSSLLFIIIIIITSRAQFCVTQTATLSRSELYPSPLDISMSSTWKGSIPDFWNQGNISSLPKAFWTPQFVNHKCHSPTRIKAGIEPLKLWSPAPSFAYVGPGRVCRGGLPSPLAQLLVRASQVGTSRDLLAKNIFPTSRASFAHNVVFLSAH